MIDSVFRTGKDCYPQVFLEEFKYVFKEKNVPKYTEYIAEDIEISSDSVREDSDEENCNEKNSDEENFIEKKLSIERVYFYILSIPSNFRLFIKYSYNLHNFQIL